MAGFDTSEDLPPIVVKQRKPGRKKTYLGGLAVSRDGMLTIDCTIRDLSETGAKLKVANRQVIPERCYLIVTGREIAYEATVVWTKRDEYGLRFLATYPLESLQRADLQFLRRLMVERLPRVSVA